MKHMERGPLSRTSSQKKARGENKFSRFPPGVQTPPQPREGGRKRQCPPPGGATAPAGTAAQAPPPRARVVPPSPPWSPIGDQTRSGVFHKCFFPCLSRLLSSKPMAVGAAAGQPMAACCRLSTALPEAPSAAPGSNDGRRGAAGGRRRRAPSRPGPLRGCGAAQGLGAVEPWGGGRAAGRGRSEAVGAASGRPGVKRSQ